MPLSEQFSRISLKSPGQEYLPRAIELAASLRELLTNYEQRSGGLTFQRIEKGFEQQWGKQNSPHYVSAEQLNAVFAPLGALQSQLFNLSQQVQKQLTRGQQQVRQVKSVTHGLKRGLEINQGVSEQLVKLSETVRKLYANYQFLSSHVGDLNRYYSLRFSDENFRNQMIAKFILENSNAGVESVLEFSKLVSDCAKDPKKLRGVKNIRYTDEELYQVVRNETLAPKSTKCDHFFDFCKIQDENVDNFSHSRVMGSGLAREPGHVELYQRYFLCHQEIYLKGKIKLRPYIDRQFGSKNNSYFLDSEQLSQHHQALSDCFDRLEQLQEDTLKEIAQSQWPKDFGAQFGKVVNLKKTVRILRDKYAELAEQIKDLPQYYTDLFSSVEFCEKMKSRFLESLFEKELPREEIVKQFFIFSESITELEQSPGKMAAVISKRFSLENIYKTVLAITIGKLDIDSSVTVKQEKKMEEAEPELNLSRSRLWGFMLS